MNRLTLNRSVAETMRALSALRKLCLALPHAPTPVEAKQLERFEYLRRSAAPLSAADIPALLAGLRNSWRRRDTETLREMARRIPPGLLERDRWLQSFIVAARTLSAAPERIKPGR